MKKIDVVTGASSGLGKEFARQIFERSRSDELWLVARRRDRLDALRAELEAKRAQGCANHPVPVALAIDLRGKAGVAAFNDFLRSKARENGGMEISTLVNNAGFGTYGPFAETPVDRSLDMIELNCVALTGVCGAALPFLRAGSVVINTASLAGFMPLGNFAVYSATKAFALNFSIALSAELKDRGVKVCALCPGPVSTEFAQVASNGARKEVLHGKPASDVARHCLKKARAGRRLSIMALKWKIAARLSAFAGRYFCARFTFKFCKRPHQ